jgi:hypothetical protein
MKRAVSRLEKKLDFLRKPSRWFYWHRVTMTFIEWEIIHDKRRNLTIYERLTVDFIGRGSWWHLWIGSSSTIREGTWLFTKRFHSILLAGNGGIYSSELFYDKEGIWSFTKGHRYLYLHRVVMAFIKGELFHETKTNLTVYERPTIHFIGKISWWELLNDGSSTKRKGTCRFRKCSLSIFLAESRDDNYWMDALPQ